MAPIIPPRKDSEKNQNGKKPQNKKPKTLWQFAGNVGATFLIFFAVLAIYSLISGANTPAPQTISISALAQDISAGKVKSVLVNGDDLNVTYVDGTNKV